MSYLIKISKKSNTTGSEYNGRTFNVVTVKARRLKDIPRSPEYLSRTPSQKQTSGSRPDIGNGKVRDVLTGEWYHGWGKNSVRGGGEARENTDSKLSH
ncbi:hypothetical protein J6590_043767 [Homalodisca vitripennis]|nr:hypothetical protein J6590_043767 [Homalodisca vitripennis]